jgi:hypothetical protein
MQEDDDLAAIKKASLGLLMPSESEAPFELFAWEGGDKLTPERLLKLAKAEPGTAVEEESLADFFRVVPKEDRHKFDKLAMALQQLAGLTVYKVGDEAERDAYIVGKTKAGRWAGLKTSVVET